MQSPPAAVQGLRPALLPQPRMRPPPLELPARLRCPRARARRLRWALRPQLCGLPPPLELLWQHPRPRAHTSGAAARQHPRPPVRAWAPLRAAAPMVRAQPPPPGACAQGRALRAQPRPVRRLQPRGPRPAWTGLPLARARAGHGCEPAVRPCAWSLATRRLPWREHRPARSAALARLPAQVLSPRGLHARSRRARRQVPLPPVHWQREPCSGSCLPEPQLGAAAPVAGARTARPPHPARLRPPSRRRAAAVLQASMQGMHWRRCRPHHYCPGPACQARQDL